MAGWILATVAVCSVLGGLQAQTNYCTTTYCSAGKVNVGCNPPATTGGPSCSGKTPAVVTLTAAQKTLILSEHNTRRSQLASGTLTPFGAATRMPTLAWDNELALQAGNNARSCVFAHDACRNTAVYAWAGQNLAMQQFYGMNKTIETLLSESIAGWWDEKKDTTQAQLDKYPTGYTGPAIGHFTQMASDQSSKVGCAVQYWLDGGLWKTYYVVCNYSVTNVIGRAIYKRGAVGSACTAGRNTAAGLTGLCATGEVVNPVPNTV